MDFEAFLKHLQIRRQCSPETLRAYRSDLQQFEDFLAECSITQIGSVNHAVLNQFIVHMREKENPRFHRTGLTDSSIARRLAAVSSYFEFERATGHPHLRNPIKDFRRKWHANIEPKPVEEYTLDLLLASMTNLRDRFLFTLFVATGLRVSEIHMLNRSSIEIQVETGPDGVEQITGAGEVVGKGKKSRKFYVDRGTLMLFAQYLQTRTDENPALFLSERRQRLAVRTMQHTLGLWCKRIGFSPINVHRLRHTFATRLANAEISSMVLKDLMGHSSFTTTQRYFELTDKTLARGYFSAMEHVGK